MEILGIDIGGSGMKGAIVNTEKGELITERHKIETPQPATPKAVTGVIQQIIDHFNWKGPLGAGFPSIVKEGVTRLAVNLSPEWDDMNIETHVKEKTGLDNTFLNDADSAGLAEIRFGGHDTGGLVVMLTFGTGIGSAFFYNGVLIPNMEFGHVEILGGKNAEKYAAARIRKEKDLSWEEWGDRVNQYLKHLERILSPSLFVIGGGVSRKTEKFMDCIKVRTPVQAATMQNNAGIIGAACRFKDVHSQVLA